MSCYFYLMDKLACRDVHTVDGLVFELQSGGRRRLRFDHIGSINHINKILSNPGAFVFHNVGIAASSTSVGVGALGVLLPGQVGKMLLASTETKR